MTRTYRRAGSRPGSDTPHSPSCRLGLAPPDPGLPSLAWLRAKFAEHPPGALRASLLRRFVWVKVTTSVTPAPKVVPGCCGGAPGPL